MITVLFIVFFILVPAGVVWLCSKSKFLDAIGPIILLYAFGILLGLLNNYIPESIAGDLHTAQDLITLVGVPLAIPLLLFGCRIDVKQAKEAVKIFLLSLVAVIASVIIGFAIFGREMPNGAEVGGLLTGVSTGGTLNMASLKMILDVDDPTFVIMNSVDMVVCTVYMGFFMFGGYLLVRLFLPVPKEYKRKKRGSDSGVDGGVPTWMSGLKLAGIALGAIVIAWLLSLLFPERLQTTMLIVILTTMGIAGSFWSKVRELKGSFSMGMFIIYVFSFTVATKSNMGTLDLGENLNMLGWFCVVIFGSFLLEMILAKLFHIDGDTAIMASVALTNSPSAVPIIAASMRSNRTVPVGLTIGVLGYALGTYLGILIYDLLDLL